MFFYALFLQGKFVFRLNVHVTVLSYAGNLRDLCFLGAVSHLSSISTESALTIYLPIPVMLR